MALKNSLNGYIILDVSYATDKDIKIVYQGILQLPEELQKKFLQVNIYKKRRCYELDTFYKNLKKLE